MKKVFVTLAVIALIAASVACSLFPTQGQNSSPIVIGEGNTVVTTQVQNAAPAPAIVIDNSPAPCSNTACEAPAYVAISWDNTCKTQSAEVGVNLKPLAEGAFFACVYKGTPATVNIPAGTLADIDLGGIFVAGGPVEITGVPNLTLRPWRTGQTAELCAQVANLTNYGQTQSPKFTASLYDPTITCP